MSVSVITPMFNEALNIEKCYRNLCEQKNINFEWVVIDDGSTDECSSIVRDIITTHNRELFDITLLEQENSGAAVARLNGINNCRYDVITILDADDQLSAHALEYAFAKISESVDIACYKLKFVDSNGMFLSEFNYKPSHWPIKGQQAFAECIDDWGLTGCFMIKKSVILNSYSYIDGLKLGNTINLDEFITRLNMYNSKNIDICDGVYFYFQNQNSTTRKTNKNYYKVIYTAIELNEFILKTHNVDWQIKSQRHLLATVWGVYSRYLKWRSKLENTNDWITSLEHASKIINISSLLDGKLGGKLQVKLYIKILLTLYLRSAVLKGNR